MKMSNTSISLTSKNAVRWKRDMKAWMLISPFLVLVTLLVWYPQIMSFVWSLFEMVGYNRGRFVGIENYVNVIRDTLFPKVFMNTLSYVLWSLILGYLPPIIVALLLNEVVHFKNGFRFCIYFPAILPGVAVSLMWYLIFFPDEGGMLNMLINMFGGKTQLWLQNPKMTIPLIIFTTTWRGMPGAMLLYYSVLQGVNRELYEAAVIDGAGVFKRITTVTIPQISGTMLIVLVRQIIGVFQILEEPMAMTGGGPNNASISLAYLAYKQGIINFRVGPSMALGNILFVLIVVLTVFYFKINRIVEEKQG